MATTTITLNIPNEIYERIKHRAEQTQRSVETELMEVVVSAIPVENDTDSENQRAVESLKFLDNKALWRIARRQLSKKEADKIETLHFKRQDEGLTNQETETLRLLMKKYDRTFLLRNMAMKMLMERGFDISEFAPKQ
jgi:plasmid stability protein